jgi:uncharacterized protein
MRQRSSSGGNILVLLFIKMLIIVRNIKFTSGLVTIAGGRSTFRSGSSEKMMLCATRSAPMTNNWVETIQQKLFSSLRTMNNLNDNKKKYYTIGITGASGLVGSALRKELASRTTVCGKPIRIVHLKRSNTVQEFPPMEEESDHAETKKNQINEIMINWNPNGDKDADTIIHPTVMAQVDTIVHLAGENVATGLGPLGFVGIRPWTHAKKDEIINSRVLLTSALSKVISSVQDHPIQFLSASGVGVYGDYYIGDQYDAVNESMDVSQTKGFLPDVSRAWEQATMKYYASNKRNSGRVIQMRFGVVQSLMGGALAKLYPIFFVGGGGIVGNGQQYLSYISSRDIARSIIHIIETPSISNGPINVCTPNPCTNQQYTSTLGQVLFRPTIIPLPALIVQLLFGEMGQEMLLGGVRVVPTKLLRSGFQFLHPTIEDVLNYAIKEESKIEKTIK